MDESRQNKSLVSIITEKNNKDNGISHYNYYSLIYSVVTTPAKGEVAF